MTTSAASVASVDARRRSSSARCRERDVDGLSRDAALRRPPARASPRRGRRAWRANRACRARAACTRRDRRRRRPAPERRAAAVARDVTDCPGFTPPSAVSGTKKRTRTLRRRQDREQRDCPPAPSRRRRNRCRGRGPRPARARALREPPVGLRERVARGSRVGFGGADLVRARRQLRRRHLRPAGSPPALRRARAACARRRARRRSRSRWRGAAPAGA